jgi:nucleotide-binding universal stress UspA family protein
MIKRILVGLAGTTYTPVAIRRAVALAQDHDAEVTGVTILDPRRVLCDGDGLVKAPNIDVFRAERTQIARAQIEQAVNEFESACSAANIRHSVVELSRYHDVMVFGLRSILEYDFLAGDPESLLIRLVSAGVRPLIAVSETFRSVNRVLIAYGDSMESAKAMKRFIQLRLWPDAQLKIVTFHSSDSKAQELLQAAESYCRAHGFQVSHQANPGDPKGLLQAVATLWGADMIVMGNSARSVLLRKVLGDTLLTTLRETRIPLFLAQ